MDVTLLLQHGGIPRVEAHDDGYKIVITIDGIYRDQLDAEAAAMYFESLIKKIRESHNITKRRIEF